MRPTQQAADSTESAIAGGPKYRKLNTTPASCTTKNTQPSAPSTPGADSTNSARYQHRNAENNIDIVQDKPKPRIPRHNCSSGPSTQNVRRSSTHIPRALPPKARADSRSHTYVPRHRAQTQMPQCGIT